MGKTSLDREVQKLKSPSIRCTAMTKKGSQCRLFAMHDSEWCHRHKDGDGVYPVKSAQAEIPSSLPGLTERQVHKQEQAIKRNIQRRKVNEERTLKRKEQQLITNAARGSTQIAESAGVQSELLGLVKLRTLDDCLMLIEYAIEDIMDQEPSLARSKIFIQAARTAGQLIIQAGVAEKAIDWFSENVKLVAGIDLEQI